MIIPLGVLLYQKAWTASLRFVFGCASSLIGSQLLLVFWQHFLWPEAANGAVSGLYEVTAAVTYPRETVCAYCACIIWFADPRWFVSCSLVDACQEKFF